MGRRGRIRLYLQLPVPITTEVVSSILVHGEVHSIQHNVIKFVRALRKVCCFLWILGFPPTIKMTTMVYN
jgi:hypothetical protein